MNGCHAKGYLDVPGGGYATTLIIDAVPDSPIQIAIILYDCSTHTCDYKPIDRPANPSGDI